MTLSICYLIMGVAGVCGRGPMTLGGVAEYNNNFFKIKFIMAACRLFTFPSRSFHLMAAYSSRLLAASSRVKAAPSLVSFDWSRFYSNKVPRK